MSSNLVIVVLSIGVVLSYFYGELAKRTNIPSVLMLIITGILAGLYVDSNPQYQYDFFPLLEVLGVVGLIMIVLEGALDLELSKEKMPLIWKATALAVFGIIGSIVTMGALFHYLLEMDLKHSILYAVPLSVISSAIVIPSINHLANIHEKEFLIYESCISDIVGIMVFYLTLNVVETGDMVGSVGEFGLTLILTIVVSLVVSVGLILLFKFLNAKVKLFFFISILFLIYALGKMMHLSPLILILVFGLLLKNNHLVFRGRLNQLMTRMEFRKMERDFHIITRETSFILRTFFFLVFGLTIDLASLVDIKVLLISTMSFILILLVRLLFLRIFTRDLGQVLFYIAPRGLITVLLFYSIPTEVEQAMFEPGIILWIVILSAVFMSYGLIENGRATGDQKPHPI